MRPLLLSGFRHLRKHPVRVFQVVLAVALGVALFVSSYVSISGIRTSISRSAKRLAGAAEWRITRGGSGSVPENLIDAIRRQPGAVAAPFVQASVTVFRPAAGKLMVFGVDMQSDAMLRLYGSRRAPNPETIARLFLTRNGVLVPQALAQRFRLHVGSTLRVATREGAGDITVAGTLSDEPETQAAGAQIAFMEIHQAQALFGTPGRVDYIDVAGVSDRVLKPIAGDLEVRSVSALSPAAQDALLRVESLFGLSLVAMLIGCFVIFSSVQVTVLERLKEVATFRAIGASRLQVFGALLLEWLVVGLVGASAGVFLGTALSTTMLRIIAGNINSMLPLVSAARAELSPEGAFAGIGIGTVTVLAAALLPALGAVRESPLAALRPQTYRLQNRQGLAFGIGAPLLVAGLAISTGGSTIQSLIAIVLSFLGLALLMPQSVLVAANLTRKPVSALFGLSGFLATDNLRKAPQRTALNVIALGGALAIMVSTATLILGLGTRTRHWIRSSLPFDLGVMASDLSTSLYSDETVPESLVDLIRRIPDVTHVYRVRKSFAIHRGHDVMVIGIETAGYLEVHRRKGSLDWVTPMTDPENLRRFTAGEGIFASDNFMALNGYRVGDEVEIGAPAGNRRFRILGSLEDYSWPRGAVIADLSVMRSMWRDSGLTYIDLQVSSPAKMPEVRESIANLTRDQYSTFVFDREQIVAVADDVLRQTTAAADVQVWLAALIGFLGIGNSLAMSVLQRQREIGLLRAVGMSRRQLGATVMVEAVLIAFAAGLLGMAGGLLGGWLPLRYFTFSVTGYLFPLMIPWKHMGIVFVAAVVIGVIASLLPMRQASEVPVLSAISYE